MKKLVVICLSFFITSCSSLNLSSVLDITKLNSSEKVNDAISIKNIWSAGIPFKSRLLILLLLLSAISLALFISGLQR